MPKIKKRGLIMNFLNVDFAKGTTALFKEAFKFKKYKAMPLPFAIIVGICQIPFVLMSFLVAAIVYVFNFFIKIIAYSAEQIHGVVRQEKDEVRLGAEIVIYFVSWPTIFFLYSLLIFSTFMLNILYIFVALPTFIWSLGGFKFHLLLSDAKDIEKEVTGKYNKIVLIVFVSVLALLLIAAYVLPVVMVVVEYNQQLDAYMVSIFGENYKTLDANLLAQQEELFKTFNYENIKADVTGKYEKLSMLPYLFVLLYTLIAFVPFPRKKKEDVAPAIAYAVEESVVVEEAAPAEEVISEEAVAEEAAEAPAEEETDSKDQTISIY